MGTDPMEVATKQAVKQKFPQSVAFMEKTRNLSLAFLSGHSIVLYRVGLAFFLVAGLSSCGNLASSGLSGTGLKFGANVTPIREIQAQKKNQATVYIQGTVENQAPLIKQWAYQINDTTGKIWVITNQKSLPEGSQVVFKGKVRYRSIPLAGKEQGEIYLEEE
ncbi:MAG: hypothetical protein RMY62_021155 [Nostoc sp. ZfuVER08]|jgi:hypothetical protein|uniref:DNA-binding protein n=1 Tax=Nostoc punctiforme FACHB-252 TaxID=1357509 RepID=A0ABR8H374_NOSPU|nr:hypothetical protein [Nostoc punctiforme]MBD2610158.1 hypothetical protein [Nostoc punctiforme FACHB-252]MDZ8016042.1 hypothetical protein [Nostoc sp. ZfuVER08]